MSENSARFNILNIGLVGVGRWGQYHIAAFPKAEGVRLVALCANTQASAAEAQATYNLPCYQDYAAFLKLPAIEAVIIASPNGLHFRMAQEALLAGKHVLVEKPMSFTRAECDELIELAAKANLTLYPGHEMRRFTLWERFKTLLDEGAIGEPKFGQIELRRYPYSSGSGGWRRDPAQVGDWLLEEPIHYFDLMLWYMGQQAGPPVSLYAAASASSPEKAAWHENFSTLVSFANGSYVNLTRTVASFHFRLQIRFTGTTGTLEGHWSAPTDRSLEPVASLTQFNFGDPAPRQLPVDQATGHAFDLHRELTAFGRAVRGETPVLSGLDGRRAVYMCQAAAESLRTGLPAKLSDWC